MSPFLQIPSDQWLTANELAFAVRDGFPVSPGHTLVVTRRLVPTWFEATAAEQSAVMELVAEVRRLLDESLLPRPDGYNVGFNAGEAAGQTVPHLHVHVIPRYYGDVADPRGGVRHVIPEKANYLQPSPTALATGHPESPLWMHLAPRVASATEIDILAAFVRLSGLDVIEEAIFAALSRGAGVRVLVSDYLNLSEPRALRRLAGWMDVWTDTIDAAPPTTNASMASPRFAARLVVTADLPAAPASFHPKAWRIRDGSSTCLVVGSSNLSRPALLSGVEWNLLTPAASAPAAAATFEEAFDQLWDSSHELTPELIDRYTENVARLWPDGPVFDEQPGNTPQVTPRPWQQRAIETLQQLRSLGRTRAIAAVATGMGKTWLAALDMLALGRALGRRPRILVIAHRAQILAQAEAAIASVLDIEFGPAETSWYLGSRGSLSGMLVIASIQKLARPQGLQLLEAEHFDYAMLDEVHHAQAPTWRRVLARLRADFVLGLTATPERADGIDVAPLFDDNVACEASIGDGIEEESLVPFHYIGIADTVQYEQIPWRSGQFDPDELERAVISSDRMQRLWTAMQQHTGIRTLVFCCSKRHALFTRDWLRSRGLTAAAVFSGIGGDNPGSSLEQLRAGSLSCLCAVDLFNEGLDVPAVDRVVMLRPTSSKVIFLQQLGRGLRTSPGKQRLMVLDFVGNHRTFARRILQLLALGNPAATWSDVRRTLHGTKPQLPSGCLLDIDLTAQDLLRKFLPQGATAAVDAYREWRDEHGRRPEAAEFLRAGYLPKTAGAAAGGWLEFVDTEGDLTAEETACLSSFRLWFRMLETTSLNKSFKMIVLRVLLDREQLPGAMDLRPLCLACRRHLLQHPVLFRDVSDSDQGVDSLQSDDDVWCRWWHKWPISRWLDVQLGERWFRMSNGGFEFVPKVPEQLTAAFSRLSSEIVDWRLAAYCISRGLETAASPQSNLEFEASVAQVNKKPLLLLPPANGNQKRPTGITEVQLPEGDIWNFQMQKSRCHTASLQGSTDNQLPDLLRHWFGENAGLPGTAFRVRFRCENGLWSVSPETASLSATVEGKPRLETGNRLPRGARRNISKARQYVDYVPIYDLNIAAGGWGPESTPEIAAWLRLSNHTIRKGYFVAQVHGQSMEPRIPSGAWCLFRPCPAGSRENRLLLVQLRTEHSSDSGGRYTVKKYHSTKAPAAAGTWEHLEIELQPLNPAYETIRLTPETASDVLINAEFVDVVA
jgi:superfamily II DNA or RNA helicase/diadenosine tetraphosphate (Ap4A) HIT family hydrolase/SOS-response transcriptional repressor LexA